LFHLIGFPFTFRYLLGFVGVLFVLRAIALAFSTYIRGNITATFMSREMSVLFRSTMRSKWSFILREKSGYIQNTVFWDVKRTTQLLDCIVQFIQSATGSLMYLFVALNISSTITIFTLLTGAVILLTLRRPLLGKARTIGEETSTAEKQLAQHITEYLQAFKMVKASGATNGVVIEANSYLEQLRSLLARSVFIQGIGSLVMQPLAILFIIGVFSFSYKATTFSLPSFAVILYLIQKIFTYLDSTQSSFGSIVQLVPYAENVEKYKHQVKNAQEEEISQGKAFIFKRAVAFENVSFSYSSDRLVLSRITALIPKGSMIGIIGGSGGGKTSLADLLLRLFQPTDGLITLDGVPVQEIQLTDWRQHVAYVSQDPFLVHASVADNIRFFADNISDDDIRYAAKQAHCNDFIESLPNGFDTILGDRGVTLSGGQRQRIALARALVRKPELLVLDEVTSALDSELERSIQEVIDELRGVVTMVVIAHRISTVTSADLIWVLENGSLVESGAPALMLNDPNSYLWRMMKLQSMNDVRH
jgi:ABC-type multidrug transport system fused ATPase/permease subunit